ncbi:hypothetical protein [Leptospira wolffii]|uniref:hypothetical protein n=1 Tax=Leptospira wolffii TaxID=409998 RepID=UPI00031A53C2|nr:hypothetical protein [Leptospira wolffii]EPG67392.1 hypothetical protein LEP1GSC061_1547 [Leptospira wolffii serovar Khorat str. Khorat-H2]
MPENFLDTGLHPHTLKELIKGLLARREIRIKTLVRLKKMASLPPRKWIKY